MKRRRIIFFLVFLEKIFYFLRTRISELEDRFGLVWHGSAGDLQAARVAADYFKNFCGRKIFGVLFSSWASSARKYSIVFSRPRNHNF